LDDQQKSDRPRSASASHLQPSTSSTAAVCFCWSSNAVACGPSSGVIACAEGDGGARRKQSLRRASPLRAETEKQAAPGPSLFAVVGSYS
jgi:hypothetical protein